MKFFGFSILLFFAIFAANAQTDIDNLPQKAKDFELKDIEGNTWSLTEMRGKVIVLNIWGISCRPCVKEIPDLNKVKAKYAEDDVVFIAVSNDSEEDLKKFSQKKDFSYHLAGNAQAMIMDYNATPQLKNVKYIDSTGTPQKTTIIALPQNIVINKKQEIIFAEVGPIKHIAAVLSKQIDKALNK